MDFVSLNIRFEGPDIPDHRYGLMKDIVSWFVDNGYHLENIRDKSTRYFQDKRGLYCVYIFEKNKVDSELSFDKLEQFLDSHNEFEKRWEYRIYSF